MNLPDFYAILGIPPDADLQTIARAYRRLAIQCHPDHGGNEREMALINEAWLTLTNPDKRRTYDAGRQSHSGAAAQAAAAEIWQQARDASTDYPRRWQDFEGWLDAVTRDFSGATYSKASGPRGIPMPTADNSVSGTAFIIAGAAVGAGIAILFLYRRLTSGGSFLGAPMIFGLLVAGGAWVGRSIHGAVADVFRPIGNTSAANHQALGQPGPKTAW